LTGRQAKAVLLLLLLWVLVVASLLVGMVVVDGQLTLSVAWPPRPPCCQRLLQQRQHPAGVGQVA
jgi:hypothetical protein